MNVKLLRYVRKEGYCCLWAWLEVNRATLTSELIKEIEGVCTARALQQNRAKYRAGVTRCEGLDSCLKKKIKEGHTIALHPRKGDGSDVE